MRDEADVSMAHAIADLQRQLAASHQALEDFTYAVSHDLRAPLRHVGAYLKIVQEDLGAGADPDILAHLQTARDAAARMGQLMDGLLELSRLGRAEMHWSAVDLGRLASDVWHQLKPECGHRQVACRIAPDMPLVRGDMALLGQLLMRLVDNALKFTRAAPRATIDIGWRAAAPGWCEVHVRDNGVGFDARLQDRLFRVFQQLHGGKEFEGLGIGLAFARGVVERHGGVIRARGDLAPGCEVSLSLPLAQVAAA